jgi:hypothetical protein
MLRPYVGQVFAVAKSQATMEKDSSPPKKTSDSQNLIPSTGARPTNQVVKYRVRVQKDR